MHYGALSDGQLTWRTEYFAKPLLIVGGRFWRELCVAWFGGMVLPCCPIERLHRKMSAGKIHNNPTQGLGSLEMIAPHLLAELKPDGE